MPEELNIVMLMLSLWLLPPILLLGGACIALDRNAPLLPRIVLSPTLMTAGLLLFWLAVWLTPRVLADEARTCCSSPNAQVKPREWSAAK